MTERVVKVNERTNGIGAYQWDRVKVDVGHKKGLVHSGKICGWSVGGSVGRSTTKKDHFQYARFCTTIQSLNEIK